MLSALRSACRPKLKPVAAPKGTAAATERAGSLCSTPQSRRRGSGKFGSSGAAAVAAVTLQDPSAMSDVASYMEDAALTEAKGELLKARFRLEEEKSRAAALEGTVAALQKQVAALEREQRGKVRRRLPQFRSVQLR